MSIAVIDRIRRGGPALFYELWLVVALVVIWTVASQWSSSFYFPSLTSILEVIARDFMSGLLWAHLMFSLVNLLLGLAIGTVVGVSVGTALAVSPRVRVVLTPFLTVMRSVPTVALIPILVVALGVGSGAKIFIIALVSTWPILLNASDGGKDVEQTLLDVTRAYRVPLWLTVRNVVFTSASPQIMTGIRIALSIAITVLVVSELYASTQGLGFYVLMSQRQFDIPRTWAGTILLALFGYLLNLLFGMVERRTLHWHYQIPRHRSAS